MKITLQNLAKRFGNDWVFRYLSHTFQPNAPCAVVGKNGSGKSTLLQLMAGIGQASSGTIEYALGSNQPPTTLPTELWYKHIAITAPYLELIEEFTLSELVKFHSQFKPLRAGINRQDFVDLIQLQHAKDKHIKYFSSGMKQRLKLGLVFYSEASVLFLDEPTTNLDAQGISWYKNALENNIKDRICVICSNQPYEYEICTQTLNLTDFKTP